jgi:hypothetical protein
MLLVHPPHTNHVVSSEGLAVGESTSSHNAVTVVAHCVAALAKVLGIPQLGAGNPTDGELGGRSQGGHSHLEVPNGTAIHSIHRGSSDDARLLLLHTRLQGGAEAPLPRGQLETALEAVVATKLLRGQDCQGKAGTGGSETLDIRPHTHRDAVVIIIVILALLAPFLLLPLLHSGRHDAPTSREATKPVLLC